MRRRALGLLLVLAACGPPGAPRFKQGTPELIEAPPALPLTPSLHVVLDRPAALEIRIADSRGERLLHWDEPARTHDVPLLGLRPRDEVEVVVTAVGEEGAADARPVRFEVGRLPSRFPEIDVLTLAPERERGLTLMPAELVSDEEGLPWMLALDGEKQVVWTWRTAVEHGDLRWDPSGSIYALGEGVAWQLDPAGEVLHQWGGGREQPATRDQFTELELGTLHHELFPTRDGRFWSLVDRPRDLDHYPCTYEFPLVDCGPARIASGRLVQFDRLGLVHQDWDLADVLNPFRIGFDSLGLLSGDKRDWVHVNAVVERPEGGVLASLRHQDALVAFTATGEVDWILAEPVGWGTELQDRLLRPIGEPFDWPYHAHGPVYDADGTIWLFDNHSFVSSPYTGPWIRGTASRVVGYRVDPVNRTVTQVAAFDQTATGPLYSRALGNAQVLPETGNVQGAWGLVTGEGGLGNKELGFGGRSVRVVEWTREGKLVSDVRLRSDVEDEAGGWRAYRAVHAPSLYAEGVEEWVRGGP